MSTAGRAVPKGQYWRRSESHLSKLYEERDVELIPPNTKIDFMGNRLYAYIVSALLILLSVASIPIIGQVQLGIDFTGGVMVQAMFKKQVSTKDIRQSLSPLSQSPKPGNYATICPVPIPIEPGWFYFELWNLLQILDIGEQLSSLGGALRVERCSSLRSCESHQIASQNPIQESNSRE